MKTIPNRVFEGSTSLHLVHGAEWAWMGLGSRDGLNRLHMDLLEAMDRIFIDLRWSGVRRICLSDAGWMEGHGRNLSAGADLNEVVNLNGSNADAFARRGQRVMEHLEWPGWKSLTILSGACMGGGCDLALSGQERWAVEGLKLAHPAAKHGILTGFGGTLRLVQLLGEQAADRLFRGLEVWNETESIKAGAAQRILEKNQVKQAVEIYLSRPVARPTL